MLVLLGAYVGINSYTYVFGGSEARAWAGLGAVVSGLLLVLPIAIASVATVVRRIRRARREAAAALSDPGQRRRT
jgi:uncharacterized membrane-anchored protein